MVSYGWVIADCNFMCDLSTAAIIHACGCVVTVFGIRMYQAASATSRQACRLCVSICGAEMLQDCIVYSCKTCMGDAFRRVKKWFRRSYLVATYHGIVFWFSYE